MQFADNYLNGVGKQQFVSFLPGHAAEMGLKILLI
jgi:hypothetical protein